MSLTPLPPKASRVRFKILGLVFVSVVINYMDRTNLSVAATALSDELKLSSVRQGFLFSAFGWTYAALQIPGGLLVDRFGPRILYTFSLIAWSVVTILQGLAGRFATLFSLRLGVGALEAPAYPINNQIATVWFPEHERARAIAIYTSGQYVGLALLAPAMTWVQYYLGWRMLFIGTGIIGVAWGIIWYVVYRDPLAHPQANPAERDYIRSVGGIAPPETAGQSPTASGNWADLRQVFSQRKLWGIYLGQFCLGANMWFFLTWFPTYLVKYRGLTFLKTGIFTSIPFLAAFAGILLSGFISDFLVKKGFSVTVARKAPVLTGLFLAASIVGANYVDNPSFIIAILATAFFGTGMASIAWIFVSILAPLRLVGLTGGAFNFIGNLSSILVPIAIGYLVQDGNFAPALIFVGALGLIGLLSYVFLVGKLERVNLEA